MYNYNLINPVNITYRNPKQNPAFAGEKEPAQNGGEIIRPVNSDEEKEGRRFPNGNKVQIDYTKNKVNIAQVIEDFKSTVAAINAPEEISSEVNSYLGLVERESKKENPSREIILSNLRNASKISDKFIEDSLKKPSTVVLDWVNALFMQQVELKSDPGFINEDFRVQIPDNVKSRTTGDVTGGAANAVAFNNTPVAEHAPGDGFDTQSTLKSPEGGGFNAVSYSNDFQNSPLNIYDIASNRVTIDIVKPIGIRENTPVVSAEASAIAPVSMPASALAPESLPETVSVSGPGSAPASVPASNESLTYSTTAPLKAQNGALEGAVSFERETLDAAPPVLREISAEERAARRNFVRAKSIVKESGDPKNALKLYDEALKYVQNSGDENLRAAIHFERGKLLDDYDYAGLALQDYNKATKCTDANLKTHAHIKMGRIYDDYVMFDPAVEQYSLAVESSEEAQNPAGKTRALRYLAALFADRYDKVNTETFTGLALDAAWETKNMKTVAKTLMDAGENYEYIGEDVKALGAYKEAAKVLHSLKDYNTLSDSYEAASDIMERLGNSTKAMNLLSKALQYRQKAELQTAGLAKSA